VRRPRRLLSGSLSWLSFTYNGQLGCPYVIRPITRSAPTRADDSVARPTMSTLDASSPPDSPDLGKGTQTHSVSSGTKTLTVWGEKTEDHYGPRPTPQQPTRSIFVSVCIVATCTSSMVMNVALGPAFAISIPYTGKDLNIQKNNMQWIVSAYSISSVGLSCGGISFSSPHLAHRDASFFFGAGSQIFTDAN
jgi:hypothetical protein